MRLSRGHDRGLSLQKNSKVRDKDAIYNPEVLDEVVSIEVNQRSPNIRRIHEVRRNVPLRRRERGGKDTR